jgi:hypothetical protein
VSLCFFRAPNYSDAKREIVEQGSHDDLIAMNGMYHKLVHACSLLNNTADFDPRFIHQNL